jgi:hypothetical protein
MRVQIFGGSGFASSMPALGNSTEIGFPFARWLMNTPETQEIGIGDIRDDRLTAAIKQVAESYELPRVPTNGEVFNRAFLPPRAERVLKN